jgi:uncharacterized membrane protein YhaH (DUF805 family)
VYESIAAAIRPADVMSDMTFVSSLYQVFQETKDGTRTQFSVSEIRAFFIGMLCCMVAKLLVALIKFLLLRKLRASRLRVPVAVFVLAVEATDVVLLIVYSWRAEDATKSEMAVLWTSGVFSVLNSFIGIASREWMLGKAKTVFKVRTIMLRGLTHDETEELL